MLIECGFVKKLFLRFGRENNVWLRLLREEKRETLVEFIEI